MLLGIDYGRKKIGIAVAQDKLASPHSVLKVESAKDAVDKVVRVVQEECPDKIVIGLSEGLMAEETKRFGRKLKKKIDVHVVFADETLSTYDAQELSKEAGKGQKKRREMEDAYAAALILQSYLDAYI